MSAAHPIADDELEGLFGWLENYLPLALAVSGGADSMALMHLVARWLCKRKAEGSIAIGDIIPPALVFTVDHGLRRESAEEASIVAHGAKALGFHHETLVWRGDKPVAGVEAAARDARYRLMHDAILRERQASSRETGIRLARLRSLVTAHHLDDQAETLLMRLARGSGVAGLSGMAGASAGFGLLILRPLLGVPKDRLIATLEAAGIDCLYDPSNDDSRFERARLRKARPQLAAVGLSNDMLALSARRLARANAALALATLELEAAVRRDHLEFTYATLDHGEMMKASEELRIRLMLRVLGDFGGQDKPPRLVQVEELAARLQDGTSLRGVTLAGCHVSARRGTVTICREAGRNGLAELILDPGACALWDGRLEVCASAEVSTRLRVAALGVRGWVDLKQDYPGLAGRRIPARAAATLPAVYQGNKLLAVPQLGPLEPALRGPLMNGVPLLRIKQPENRCRPAK